MPHFLSELVQKLCLATYQEWAWSFCTVNIEHICCVATTVKVHGRFALVNIEPWGRCVVILCFIVYVQFIFHFVLLAKLCSPGCPAVLAWLHLQVQSKHTQIQYWLGYTCKCEASTRKSTCYCFFIRTKRPCTFPTIHSNPCTTATFKAGGQQLLTI